MKTTDFVALVCICLAGFGVLMFEKMGSAIPQRNLPMLASPMGAMESNGPSGSKISDDQDAVWLEKYESNGPQGTNGAPMQNLSSIQFSLVMFIFVACGIMLTLAVKNQTKAANSCTKNA